jgi:uncharacterized protein YbjT (DUF2867 family)
MKILVTGGTGHLGRALVPRLTQRGHEVRVLARRPGSASDIEWVAGDLASGHGLARAVAGVDVVLHAATSSPIAQRGAFRLADFFRSPTDVDVDGTRALVELAEQHGVRHFVHVSIVGLEDTKRLPYSRVKLAAEDVVRGSHVPWSILRATGFYWLLDRLCVSMTKGRWLLLPGNMHMQPVDSDDFASWVVDGATGAPRGRGEDFAGPEVLTMREVMEQYLAARGIRRSIRSIPLPSGVLAALERGQTAPDARRGTTTWKEWLAAHPASAQMSSLAA